METNQTKEWDYPQKNIIRSTRISNAKKYAKKDEYKDFDKPIKKEKRINKNFMRYWNLEDL